MHTKLYREVRRFGDGSIPSPKRMNKADRQRADARWAERLEREDADTARTEARTGARPARTDPPGPVGPYCEFREPAFMDDQDPDCDEP